MSRLLLLFYLAKIRPKLPKFSDRDLPKYPNSRTPPIRNLSGPTQPVSHNLKATSITPTYYIYDKDRHKPLEDNLSRIAPSFVICYRTTGDYVLLIA